MKKIIWGWLMLFSFYSSKAQKKDDLLNQPILELSKKKWSWMADKKVDSLIAVSDDKAMFVHMGESMNKQQEIETIKTGGIWYKKAEIYQSSVNIIGKTAIVLSRIKLLAVVGGTEVINPFIVTEVYINEDNRWRLGVLSFTKLLTKE